MAATKYVGYVGGVAIAAGVGAALAVAAQGTAHADTEGGSSAKQSSSTSKADAGPKKGKGAHATRGAAKHSKPVSTFKDSVEKHADRLERKTTKVTKSASKASATIAGTLAKTAKSSTPSPNPSTPKADAEDFEAKQVERLKSLFTPDRGTSAEPKPESSARQKLAPVVATADAAPQAQSQAQDDSAADAPAWNPNPFRPDDPEPTDFPDAITELKAALLQASPDPLDPFVREATEQIYRGSQIVPWVNAVVPISKILPSLADALSDDDLSLDARQTIINELIKTTPPGSFLYYGFDIVADLINMEGPGAELKHTVVAGVWDLLDPLELAHHRGESGI